MTGSVPGPDRADAAGHLLDPAARRAGLRKAIQRLKSRTGFKSVWPRGDEKMPEYYEVIVRDNLDRTIAIFDLRQCYLQRAPLKGIKKALTKAIRPQRKKRAKR